MTGDLAVLMGRFYLMFILQYKKKNLILFNYMGKALNADTWSS